MVRTQKARFEALKGGDPRSDIFVDGGGEVAAALVVAAAVDAGAQLLQYRIVLNAAAHPAPVVVQ